MSEVFGVGHIFMIVSLHSLAIAVVSAAITDVTMAAICPGKDECSLAIYLTGAQQLIIGLGSVVAMPMIGKLSDTYGRKPMLTLPMILSIFPLGLFMSTAILAYSTKKYYFYAYYVLNILIGATTQGAVQFLAFAYMADNTEERKRGSLFGIMSGVASSSILLGSVSSRILTISATFQIATLTSVVALLYMMVFLQESILKNNITTNSTEADCLLEKIPPKNWKFLPSLDDTICMLRTSPTFSKVAIVAFLSMVADVGLGTSFMYYLKARFQFNKDQFADLIIIGSIAQSISQLVLIPILTPLLGEENLLCIGLFCSCAQTISSIMQKMLQNGQNIGLQSALKWLQATLISFAWSPWVPYAAIMMCIITVFKQPCILIIASKQTRPSEQGKALGCITGVFSFASIISTLAFTPLIALFLSDNAPFYFPGFSILCSGFIAMIGLAQSIALRQLPVPPIESCSIINNNHIETLN